jgi:hypothetical protein
VRKEVACIFSPGWDKGYEDSILRKAPKGKACAEFSTAERGNRNVTHDEFIAMCFGEEGFEMGPGRYAEVATAGKTRPLTIQPLNMQKLMPLHDLIFSRMRKRCPWLLIGPPTAEKLEKAGFDGSAPVLSGDYKGATDNLDLRVSSAILSAIFERARYIPEPIRAAAHQSLHHDVMIDDELITITRGTMMGYALSFPLLCLYNFLCTKYALGEAPMLVNGDDVIAQTERPDRWFGLLPPLGLEPEKTKTGVSRTHLNINSTDFVFRKGRWVLVPIVRLKSLVTYLPRASDLGPSMNQFLTGFSGNMRQRVANLYTTHRRDILKRSPFLPHEMGFHGHIAIAALKHANVYSRLALTPARYREPVPLPDVCPTTAEMRTIYVPNPDASLRKLNARANFHQNFEGKGKSVDSEKERREWWKQVDESARQRLNVSPSYGKIARGLYSRFIGCAKLTRRSSWYTDILSKAERLSRVYSLTVRKPVRDPGLFVNEQLSPLLTGNDLRAHFRKPISFVSG